MINEEAATQMSTVNQSLSCQTKPNKKRRDGETLTCCLQEEGLVPNANAPCIHLSTSCMYHLSARGVDSKTTVKGKGESSRDSRCGPQKKEGFIIACMHNASWCPAIGCYEYCKRKIIRSSLIHQDTHHN